LLFRRLVDQTQVTARTDRFKGTRETRALPGWRADDSSL
jgi:hypothetical protein